MPHDHHSLARLTEHGATPWLQDAGSWPIGVLDDVFTYAELLRTTIWPLWEYPLGPGPGTGHRITASRN